MSRRTTTASLAVLGMLALAPAWVATAGTAAAAETTYTDLGNDGLEDVVVGVPGEDLGDHKNAGRVEIRFGNGDVQGLHLPHPRSGDRFGAGISALDDGEHDLLVGAPGRDVNGKANAGSVYLFTANKGRLSLLYGYHLGQHDTPETDVPGALQAGARSGATLAPGPAKQHWWGATAPSTSARRVTTPQAARTPGPS
ncbi:MAG: hypothetical protein ACRDMV_14205 [Streptosporangiales bacterium]